MPERAFNRKEKGERILERRLYIQRQYLFNDSDFEYEVRHRQTIKGV